MKEHRSKRPPSAVILAVIAVILTAAGTFAWLVLDDEVLTRTFSLSNFDAYAKVYFDGSTNEENYRNADNSLSVDIDTPSAENYIGKLRVDALYKGRGRAYMRLKIVEQWKKDDGSTIKAVPANISIPFNIASPYLTGDTGDQAKWYDNRQQDYCLYYAMRLVGTNNTSYDTIPVITAGFDQSAFAANYLRDTAGLTLDLSIELQAVQINRYPQFWGIDSLPWPE